MFDAQRTAVKQSEQAFKQGLAAQRSAGMLALTGLKGQESLQRQSLELAQATTHAYMDAASAMMNTGQTRDQYRMVDETFARLKEAHQQFFDAVEREMDRGVTSMDELSDDYVEALDSGTDQLLEAHQTVEDSTAENFDEFSRQLREQLERTQEMQDDLEDRFEEQTDLAEHLLDQQNEQAERFQQELEEEVQRIRQQTEERMAAGQPTGARGEQPAEWEPDAGTRSAAEGEQAAEAQEDIERIDGLGPTFRDRLTDAGITTMDDLASADPVDVAAAADVSEERAREWIDEASS